VAMTMIAMVAPPAEVAMKVVTIEIAAMIATSLVINTQTATVSPATATAIKATAANNRQA